MIRIELLSKDNFHPDSLEHYQRKQEVKKVYRKQDGEYILVDCVYTEDWDSGKRQSIAETISGDDYITYLALDEDKVVGFIGLLKQLFCKGKEEARKAGAQALYISACSSEETIAFYKAMGGKLTDCPIKRIADDEPYDLQMVCYLEC